MDHAIEVFVTAVGLMMSYGYYPQAWRMWRTKSAAGVSAASYGIFALGTTTWTAYGFYKHDTLIIASFFFGMIGSWLVLALMYRFRNAA